MKKIDAIANYGTLYRMFFAQADLYGDRPFILEGSRGKYRPVSWSEAGREVRLIAAGLLSMGIGGGDRVAIMSYNRPEWLFADLAIMSLGAVTVPIYHTSTHAATERILSKSGTRVVFVARSDKAEMLLACSPGVDTIISLDPVGPDDAGACSMDYGTLKTRGEAYLKRSGDNDLEERMATTGPDDVATIIYTSGTTGDPKGVMLTHGNILFDAEAGLSVQPVGPGDIHLSFLPLSHVFERTVGQFLMIMAGATIAYATSMLRVAENIPDVRPTVMISVPRFFEKLHRKVTDAVKEASSTRRRIFYWGQDIGRRYNSRLMAGSRPGPFLKMGYRMADRLVFSKLKARLGGRLRFFVSGGAPLAPEVIEFFLAAGIQIMEGYGLTEAAPVVSVNPFGALRPGTVGKPLPGIEVRIEDDGELLVKGRNVMAGYFEDAAATAEVIGDGWLHTGDIARIEDGYIRITGRKKDLIVTSGGKNISPSVVENLIAEDDLVSQVMVYGDRKKFISALVVPAYDRIAAMTGELGLGALSEEELRPENLSSDPRLAELMMKRIESRSANLMPHERVKKILLLDRELTEDEGEMTSTMKIKRHVVAEKFRDRLDALYSD